MWPLFLEIPVPVREPLRDTGPPITELVRFARVPALLCRLFLEVEVPLKEGSGDLDREDEIEVLVPFLIALLLGIARLPSSPVFAFGLWLELRTEGILLPLATAVVGRAGASGLIDVSTFVTVGLEILLGATGVGAFPRFHTL